MSFDYGRSQATADRLIARFGQTGLLRRLVKAGPAHNPTTTPQDHAATFVVDEYRNSEVDGTRVLATDKKVLLAKGSLPSEPSTADRLVIGGVEHSIVRVELLAPGGITVFWTLQCRR